MITDTDIKKLKAVFVTKDEIKDLFEQYSKQIVKDVAYMLQDSVIKILDQHERRLDQLERRVGGFQTFS